MFLIAWALYRTRDDATKSRMKVLNWMNAIALCDFFISSMLFSLVQARLGHVGFPPSLLKSLLMTVYPAANLFGGFICGVLGDDDIISRRSLLLISSASTLILHIALLFSFDSTIIFCSIILSGFFNQSMNILFAITTDLTQHSSFTRYSQFGFIMAISTLCSVIAPPIGRLLQSIHIALPSTLSLLLLMYNAEFVFRHLPTTLPSDSSTGLHDARSFMTIIRDVDVLTIAAFHLSILFLQTSMACTLVDDFYSRRFYVGSFRLTVSNAIASLFALLSSIFMLEPSLRRWNGEHGVMCVCLMGIVSCRVMEAVWPSWGFFLLYSIMCGIPSAVCLALLNATVTNMLSNAVPSKHFGKTIGLLNAGASVCTWMAAQYGTYVLGLTGSSSYGLRGVSMMAASHYLILCGVIHVSSTLKRLSASPIVSTDIKKIDNTATATAPLSFTVTATPVVVLDSDTRDTTKLAHATTYLVEEEDSPNLILAHNTVVPSQLDNSMMGNPPQHLAQSFHEEEEEKGHS